LKKILFIYGTRPEGIKIAPLVKKFKKNTNLFETKVCITSQHRVMLDQVMDFFKIKADYDLNIMKPDQTLFDVTIESLKGLQKILNEYEPDLIFIQGDTTTVLAGALAGFYKRIDVAHLEAGLRSGNKYSPYPEEINRTLASHLAAFHFAPTKKAKKNLLKEQITKNVWEVGNTVIDALLLGLKIIKENGEDKYEKYFNFIDFSKRIILVTCHRRESFGKPFEQMCDAMKTIGNNNIDVQIVYPVHLNPNVRKPVNKFLKGNKQIHLIEPLDYQYLIWLMNRSYLVLTDSGGIQEEAPALGKPVLVMRDVTERQEGIDAGTAKLVGTDRNKIINETQNMLDNHTEYKKMATAVNPYGVGDSSEKIVKILTEYYSVK